MDKAQLVENYLKIKQEPKEPKPCETLAKQEP